MEYSYKQSMISPTITTEAPSLLINLAAVPKAFSCSRQNPVEDRLLSSNTVSARENNWPYSSINTRSNSSFSDTQVHKNIGKLYGAENFIKTRFDSDEVSVPEESFLSNRKFEKREATRDLSAYFQVTKKRSNSIPNSMLLLNNPLIDKPVRSSSNIDQPLPLPDGFGEVELEAIRILESFSLPRDTTGAIPAKERSILNSSPATSMKYVPPAQLFLPSLIVAESGRVSNVSEQNTPVSSRVSSPNPSDKEVERQEIVKIRHVLGPVSPASSGVEESRSEEEGRSPGIFRCEYPHCGKTFGRLYNLKSHTRTHTDDRPFKCNQCEQAFSRNHDLKRHQKIHMGIKPFECTACGKKFSRMDALGRHRAKKPECLDKSV